MKYNFPIVIFAGGKSRRMGQDKALLPFQNYTTLTEFQYHKLSQLFEKVYISTKTDKFDFNANLILDNNKISSPLVGLISIFETLSVEKIFVLSVDSPLVKKEVFDKIIKSFKPEYNTIIAKSSRGIEPLCGIYTKEILPYAYEQLKQDNHKLTYLLQTLKTKLIPFEEETSFTNLNYYVDYEKALHHSFS